MLISNWFLLEVLILVQSAICSEVQDATSENGKLSKQLPAEIETYKYHHPPHHEDAEEMTPRKEKSINIDEQIPPPQHKTRRKVLRRNKTNKTNNESNLEIPVVVVYDSGSTTRSTSKIRARTTQTTSSPAAGTPRVLVHRRRPQPTNISKKIDIRQTTIENTYMDKDKVSEKINTSSENLAVLSSTVFPKRSRESYFKKRTESPTPRVRILEEKNFVYSHSGNFHYSFVGDDGTKISSEGSLKTFENKKTGESVSGSVFYKDNDGKDFSLSYTADENGYRPTGAHLPTPPPLPPAIARALKYIADKSTTTPTTRNDY